MSYWNARIGVELAELWQANKRCTCPPARTVVTEVTSATVTVATAVRMRAPADARLARYTTDGAPRTAATSRSPLVAVSKTAKSIKLPWLVVSSVVCRACCPARTWTPAEAPEGTAMYCVPWNLNEVARAAYSTVDEIATGAPALRSSVSSARTSWCWLDVAAQGATNNEDHGISPVPCEEKKWVTLKCRCNLSAPHAHWRHMAAGSRNSRLTPNFNNVETILSQFSKT